MLLGPDLTIGRGGRIGPYVCTLRSLWGYRRHAKERHASATGPFSDGQWQLNTLSVCRRTKLFHTHRLRLLCSLCVLCAFA